MTEDGVDSIVGLLFCCRRRIHSIVYCAKSMQAVYLLLSRTCDELPD